MGMIITREYDLGVIPLVKDRFTFRDERLLEPFINDLATRMTHQPESILVLVGRLFHEIRAVLVAFDPGPPIPFIQVAQLWSDPNNLPNWYKPFFARCLMWASARGKDYLRGETYRNTDAIYRRFGFVSASQNVTFDLRDFNSHLQTSSEDFVNGRP